MSSRNDYESLFLQNGISRNELCMMPESEYQKKLHQLLSQTKDGSAYYDPSNTTSYRYISQKLAQQLERDKKRGRREPLIQKDNGIDSAYQSSGYQNNYNYGNFHQHYYDDSNTTTQNTPDSSQYAAYDEDAALQAALQASLEEHYRNQSQSSFQNDIPQEEISTPESSAPEPESRQPEPPIDQPIPHSSSYSHVFKPTKERTPSTEDQRIFDEQTQNYYQCQEEAFRKEMNENLEKHFEENQQQIELEEKERKASEVVSKYYSLKPEPKSGVTFAVMIQNQRYIRKFDPETMGRDIYTWVAGQTIDEDDEDEKLYFDEFELQIPGIGIIAEDQTIAEQGIKGRVMMNIIRL